VREALRELTQQNLVYAIKGKGTYVSPRHTEVNFIGSVTGSADDLRRFGRRVTTQILEQEPGEATSHESERLLIAEGTPVVRLTRLRRVDDIPWMLTRAVLPARLVQGLEKLNLENNSLYNILRRNYSLQTAGADRWIDAVFASEDDAALLEIDIQTPVLGIDSISWLFDGSRFEAYYALHRCDNVRFHIGIR
jgi:GntR family transcriptional regulator